MFVADVIVVFVADVIVALVVMVIVVFVADVIVVLVVMTVLSEQIIFFAKLIFFNRKKPMLKKTNCLI